MPSNTRPMERRSTRVCGMKARRSTSSLLMRDRLDAGRAGATVSALCSRVRAVQQGTQELGLGLYLSKGIIEAHGDRASGRSQPGLVREQPLHIFNHGMTDRRYDLIDHRKPQQLTILGASIVGSDRAYRLSVPWASEARVDGWASSAQGAQRSA